MRNSCVPLVAKATGRRDSGNGEQSSSACSINGNSCFIKTYNYHELNTNCHKLFCSVTYSYDLWMKFVVISGN